MKELTLDGVVGIVEGVNPKLIRAKLEAYCQDAGNGRQSAPGEEKVPAYGAGA